MKRVSIGIVTLSLFLTALTVGGPSPQSASAASVIDVSTYGHDLAAVQAAAAALNPGDTLYFPAGTYVLEIPAGSDPAFEVGAHISDNDVTIEGDGDASKILIKRASGNTDFIAGLLVDGARNVMRDLMIIGNDQSDAHAAGVKWRSDDSVVENNWFDGNGQEQLEIGWASNVMVRNNSFRNAQGAGYGYGILPANEAQNVVIRNNYFFRHRVAVAHGVYSAGYPGVSTVIPATNVYIADNVFQQDPNATYSAAAIDAHPSPDGTLSDVDGTIYVLDNEIYGSGSNAVEMNGWNGVIRGNYIHDNAVSGIAIGADAGDWLVVDNAIDGSGSNALRITDYHRTPIDYRNNPVVDVLRGTYMNSGQTWGGSDAYDLRADTSSTDVSITGVSSPTNYGTADAGATSALSRSRFTSFADAPISVPDFGLPANKSNVLEFDLKDAFPANAGVLGYYKIELLIDGVSIWQKDPAADGTNWAHGTVDVTRQIAGKKDFTVAFRTSLTNTVGNFQMDVYVDNVTIGSTNIVANGGFESATDWTFSGSGSTNFTGARSSVVNNGGTYSYQLHFPPSTTGSAPEFGQASQVVKQYQSRILTFWHKDSMAANSGLLGYYAASVLVNGTAVWSKDPLVNGTSWTQYTVEIGRELAWAPSYALVLQGGLINTVSNFGLQLSWDDVKVDGVDVDNAGFESGTNNWTYGESADGYWSGAVSTTTPHSGSNQYTLAFPDYQFSNPGSYGWITQNRR